MSDGAFAVEDAGAKEVEGAGSGRRSIGGFEGGDGLSAARLETFDRYHLLESASASARVKTADDLGEEVPGESAGFKRLPRIGGRGCDAMGHGGLGGVCDEGDEAVDEEAVDLEEGATGEPVVAAGGGVGKACRAPGGALRRRLRERRLSSGSRSGGGSGELGPGLAPCSGESQRPGKLEDSRFAGFSGGAEEEVELEFGLRRIAGFRGGEEFEFAGDGEPATDVSASVSARYRMELTAACQSSGRGDGAHGNGKEVVGGAEAVARTRRVPVASGGDAEADAIAVVRRARRIRIWMARTGRLAAVKRLVRISRFRTSWVS